MSYVSDESIRRPVYDALGDKYPDWERPTFENMHILAVGQQTVSNYFAKGKRLVAS